ncbi:cuticle protein 16.5-like [Macrobrachium nipponense]|uniref:cuticle protein 16.5-like n=1 Tax=Macrobrachium nipponense TaxID=159736 RepID=UPI0030C86909
MKFAVLLALVGVASCRPSLWDDVEYSYVDAAGRIVKVDYDADDYLGLGWASPVPSLYRAVSTVPAALPYMPTPVSTQYVHVAAPAQAAPAPQVVPRYVYVDDDLDDDAVYMEVSQPLVMPRSAAAPVVPSLAAAAAPVIPRVAAAPLVTRAAPAVPVVPQQPSPTAVFRAAPVPTLKAAIAGASNIEVVHKYRNSDDDDDDDDSEEK